MPNGFNIGKLSPVTEEHANVKNIKPFLLAGLALFYSACIAAETTHIGLPPSKLIALELYSDIETICTNNRSFFRIQPNGTRDTTVYEVPGNKYLVVTDVVWVAVPSPTSFTPGRVVTMRLDVRKPDGTYLGSPFRSTPQLITSEHGTMVGNSEHLTTGFRVGSGKQLCAYAISETASSGAVNSVRKAIVYGYHVNKK